MSRRKPTRDIHKVVYKLFLQLWKLAQTVTKRVMHSLLRSFMVTGRRQRSSAKAGFVLPTVAMMLLVLALVVAAILVRTGSRTSQVMGERDAQVIYNAATPAIERAKAKLEYLFRQDDRRPNGVPSEAVLNSMLLDDGVQVRKFGNQDPYTYSDEKRIDINGGVNDNAWTYQIDVDNDGKKETVVYSIMLLSAMQDNSGNVTLDLTNSDEKNKAKNLIVRNGPINTIEPAREQCRNLNLQPEAGWYPVSTATLKKTFQVTAVVLSNKQNNKSITTLEFQQERQVDKGNKWGVWYRYDLDVFPGNTFNWNGSMHTEGSLMVGDKFFTAYLISSDKSCLYEKTASEVTVAKSPRENAAFLGQFVAGTVSVPSGTGYFHLQGAAPITSGTAIELRSDNDTTNATPADVSLNPVKLFTEGIPVFRNTGAATNPNGLSATLKDRLRGQSESAPYVDDTYRADDRYGPKPDYNGIKIDTSSRSLGNRITNANDQTKLTNNTMAPTDPDLKDLGLDGYWERRAWAEGLRVIVGQRLELGNLYGWGNNDPLNPTNTCPGNTRCHEARQRRTLRDNLAAVQATAVYHRVNANANTPATGNTGGNFPIAFIATTAHPGTAKTITNSTSFNLVLPSQSPNPIYSNFFTGEGTDGWEYEVVPGAGETEAAFAGMVNNTGSSLRKALENLAKFAGDPSGAFPPAQNNVVHPQSQLTMWGDYSNLRRALSLLGTVGGYNNLSIADKSYIHTAAGTLGILAYNISSLQSYTASVADVTTLNTALSGLSFSGQPGLAAGSKPDDYIRAIAANVSAQKVARLLHLREQIARDREFGFAPPPTLPVSTYTVSKRPAGATTGTFQPFSYGGVTYNQTDTVNLSCNIGNLGLPSAISTPANQADEEKLLRILTSFCSPAIGNTPTALPPKFPSLYYIFPNATHAHNGGAAGITQPNAEPYIADSYIQGINPGNAYQAITANEITTGIALRPKQPGNTSCGDQGWCLPTAGSGRPNMITDPNGNQMSVAFLDRGIFDGREMMAVRVLDVDLDMLRKTARGTATLTGGTSVTETLLPASGIVYAFREDAVREDAIARPANGTNPTDVTVPGTPRDPAVNTTNGISPKPVDMYADPDRRPYGFRLRNGADLRRAPGGSANNRVQRGLTLISDNPVYIQGNFNLHSTNGTTGSELQEFQTKLADNWSNFYSRNDLNTNFAQPDTDTWRPSEILADAVSILSDAFKEGNIEDGLRDNGVQQSFRGMNRPNSGNSRSWIREDNSIAQTSNIPVRIDRNGNPSYCNSTTPVPCTTPQTYSNSDYIAFSSTDKQQRINRATETWTNATIVSGVVPFRENQMNGGFHNFPRFIEHWFDPATPLHISGSFVQLNFSTYATGPFDQDAWEPTTITSPSGTQRWFYEAPTRRWGYDVGLQLAPAGPLAQRFVTPGRTRSEFYQELDATDAYVCRLRLALNASNAQLDPSAPQVCNQ